MPTYRFLNNDTGEEFEDFMSIADMQKYLSENKHITQIIGAPPLVDPTRLGMKKPDNGFRDVLKKIKSKHRGSNINTW